MKPLKQLSELDQMDKAKRYPSVPAHAIPVKKYSDATANGLTQAIIEWLTLNGCYVTRINTTGRKLKDVVHTNVIGQQKVIPGKWVPGTTRTGTADIHAIIEGRHVSIEVKIGKDKMSEAQRKTKADIEKAGGIYWVVKSFDELIAYVKNLDNTRKN